VDELHHEPVMVWSTRELSVLEADVSLLLADRTTLSFPVTHILRCRDVLIEEATVHVYLESRLALAMSAFDRLRSAGCSLRRLV
jgi:hypothetical protein